MGDPVGKWGFQWPKPSRGLATGYNVY